MKTSRGSPTTQELGKREVFTDFLPRQVGGSFAPPLDKKRLDECKKLIDGCADRQVKDAMGALYAMAVEFAKTPRSKLPGAQHPSGVGAVVPLEPAEIERMDLHVPWREELDMYAALFGKITDKPLRDAAYHLLWYGYELYLDREPITTDTL